MCNDIVGSMFKVSFELFTFRNFFAYLKQIFMERNLFLYCKILAHKWLGNSFQYEIISNSNRSVFKICLDFSVKGIWRVQESWALFANSIWLCFMLFTCTSDCNTHRPLCVMAHQIVLRCPVNSGCLFGI